jgi:hypothetical protein
MQLVTSGEMEICINGEVRPYFRNKRGVRQGGFICPLLFHFTIDALVSMMQTSSRARHIHGVVPHMISRRYTHLQYGEDIFFFSDI